MYTQENELTTRSQTMRSVLFSLFATMFVLAGCTNFVPYRSAGLNKDDSCRSTYAGRFKPDTKATSTDTERCWARSIEERDEFDLLFAEFTDQGWVQGSSDLKRPNKDYIDLFLDRLRTIYADSHKDPHYDGLSLVVFVHGWHHTARPDDDDVTDFRRLLADMAKLESRLAGAGKSRRVVGIYIGWRGQSVDVPIVDGVTFWERKNTAERVALGTVRELLLRLDHFRDRARNSKNKRDVRMLTIGHSFGGLITYEALGSEFLRAAVRFKDRKPGKDFDKFMSRVGDLVVIVNPAFEGARYEPLYTAGQRLCGVEPNQLPLLVMATSRADQATRQLFPAARQVSTLFERSTGEEDDAIVQAIGHNTRYITHELSLADADEAGCRCRDDGAAVTVQAQVGDLKADRIAREYEYMKRFAHDGFGPSACLCGGLKLEATSQWYPTGNPFWVVRTTKEIVADHGDIFNPNFVAFIRQLYLGLIYARHGMPNEHVERNPCRNPR